MAINAQGTIVKRAGVEIAAVETIDLFDGEATDIPATHLRSTTKEYLTGLRDEGNVSFTMFYISADAAQQGMKADRAAQTSSSYSVTFVDATVATFTAFCKKFHITGIAVDGIPRVDVSLKVTGDVVWS